MVLAHVDHINHTVNIRTTDQRIEGKALSANQFDLLSIRNETFIQDVVFHHEIESTNSAILELARESVKTPLLVVTDKQTAGRGRGANTWWSSEGALTFSLLLDFPMLAPAQLSSFSLTVGLAVCQTIEHFAPVADLAIKWPNDVYFNEKKIAGILIERPDANEPRLAVGIGINVNNSLKSAPDEVNQNATSLIDELETEQSLTLILFECLKQLERRARDHIHKSEELLDQWRAYCMLTGRTVKIDAGGRLIAGECQGIDASGELLVAGDSGLERIVAGSVVEF